VPMTEDSPFPAAVRASDADREVVAERLSDALADGRLSVDEHRQRIDRLYVTKTRAELVPLTADLGTCVRHGRQVPVERVRPQVAIVSSSMSRPTGRVGGRILALGLLGNMRIDLSHAAIDEGGVEIISNATLGAVDIVVPQDARVKMTGFPLLGVLSPTVKPGPTDGPTVTVRASALLGSVTIHRAEPEQAEG
jgi:Domain of unknown function (DUF1707)